MKNQLTLIAALPSGAGQAAHLEPEVGKARAPIPEVGFDMFASGRFVFMGAPSPMRATPWRTTVVPPGKPIGTALREHWEHLYAKEPRIPMPPEHKED